MDDLRLFSRYANPFAERLLQEKREYALSTAEERLQFSLIQSLPLLGYLSQILPRG
jgi:hypothetical protein